MRIPLMPASGRYWLTIFPLAGQYHCLIRSRAGTGETVRSTEALWVAALELAPPGLVDAGWGDTDALERVGLDAGLAEEGGLNRIRWPG